MPSTILDEIRRNGTMKSQAVIFQLKTVCPPTNVPPSNLSPLSPWRFVQFTLLQPQSISPNRTHLRCSCIVLFLISFLLDLEIDSAIYIIISSLCPFYLFLFLSSKISVFLGPSSIATVTLMGALNTAQKNVGFVGVGVAIRMDGWTGIGIYYRTFSLYSHHSTNVLGSIYII